MEKLVLLGLLILFCSPVTTSFELSENKYQTYRNGSVMFINSWNSNLLASISFTEFSVGFYNFTIVFTTASGLSTSDTVFITIFSSVTPTDSVTSSIVNGSPTGSATSSITSQNISRKSPVGNLWLIFFSTLSLLLTLAILKSWKKFPR